MPWPQSSHCKNRPSPQLVGVVVGWEGGVGEGREEGMRRLKPPSDFLHKTPRHVETTGDTHSKKAQGVFTRTNLKKDTNKPAQALKDLSRFPSYFYCLSPRPSPQLSQPVHGERESISCRDSRPLRGITQLPGRMHFMAKHVQSHVTTSCHLCRLPTLQEQRDLVTRPHTTQ